MTKTVHTVTLPNGEVAKRESVSRTYSHVVIGQPSYEWYMAQATASFHAKTDRSNFSYYAGIAASTAGVPYPYTVKNGLGQERTYDRTNTQEEIDRAAAKVRGCHTAEEYVAAQLQRRIAEVDEKKANGFFDRWHAICWSSRYDLAQKAAASRDAVSYTNISIAEATRITK